MPPLISVTWELSEESGYARELTLSSLSVEKWAKQTRCFIIATKTFHYLWIRHGNAFGRVCLCVCMTVNARCCVTTQEIPNLWKPWLRQFIFGTQIGIHLRNLQVKFVSRSSGQGQGHRSKKAWNLISPPLSVTEMAQSHCNCTDDKSIEVIQGMTLPACIHAGCRRQVCADFKFLIRSRPADLCGLQISDPRTDCIMTQRVYI